MSIHGHEYALARKSDPTTSHRAAAKARDFYRTHEGIIFGAIADSGRVGVTYREIAARTKMEPVAVARRLAAMERRKLVKRLIVMHVYDDCRREYLSRDGMAIWVQA